MKNVTTISLLILLHLTACSSRFIQKVSPETKTKLGFEITAPSKCAFFVENEQIKSTNYDTEDYKKLTDKLYNKYGPATDTFFIGRTNAKDFKFNLNGETYYLEVSKLPQRTAMVLFDGKNAPKVVFRSKKYEKFIKKIK